MLQSPENNKRDRQCRTDREVQTETKPEIGSLQELRVRILEKLNGPHTKAREQAPAAYPPRQLDPSITSVDDPAYMPGYYASPAIYGDPNTIPPWAEPLPLDPNMREQYLAELPRNPGGPTGLYGPGCLGKPVNWAADPVVFSVDPETGEIYQIQIQRELSDGVLEWAIPGGMVDSGEAHLSAAVRELEEETGVEIANRDSVKVYQGYVDDYRNTDTHWIQSSVFMFYLPYEEARVLKFEAQDKTEGIKKIGLRKLDADSIDGLFASHAEFVQLSLIALAENIDNYVSDLRTAAKALDSIYDILGIPEEHREY